MEVTAKTRFVRISPTKVRDLARTIHGQSASEAMQRIQFSSRKGAKLLLKTLKSAIANAENNAKLSADTLLVKEAVVDRGPVLKRFRARARGMAGSITKKMSHIKIVLTDGQQADK